VSFAKLVRKTDTILEIEIVSVVNAGIQGRSIIVAQPQVVHVPLAVVHFNVLIEHIEGAQMIRLLIKV
jgi:hypothetical protein